MNSEPKEIKEYVDLIKVMRSRIVFICNILDKGENMNDFWVECLWIQIRFLLESAGNSLLIVHKKSLKKDDGGFVKSFKDWRIWKVLYSVEKEVPRFYPIDLIVTDKFGNRVKRESNWMTQKNLTDAIAECGKYLHSLNPLKNSKVKPKEEQILRIEQILNDINGLLEDHYILFNQNKPDETFYWIRFVEEGSVEAHPMQLVDP